VCCVLRPEVGRSLRNLIKKMLTKEPVHRITLPEIKVLITLLTITGSPVYNFTDHFSMLTGQTNSLTVLLSRHSKRMGDLEIGSAIHMSIHVTKLPQHFNAFLNSNAHFQNDILSNPSHIGLCSYLCQNVKNQRHLLVATTFRGAVCCITLLKPSEFVR